jgi:hypothetical protein
MGYRQLYLLPSESRLFSSREGLLCRLADRDFVLRGRGLRCGLRIFGCLRRLLRLGLRVHCMNCLNRIAHMYHLTRLNLGKGRINFSAPEKSERKQ